MTKCGACLAIVRVWHRACPLHRKHESQAVRRSARANWTQLTLPPLRLLEIIARIRERRGHPRNGLPIQTGASLRPYRATSAILGQSFRRLSDLCAARSSHVPRDHMSKPLLLLTARAEPFAIQTRERWRQPPKRLQVSLCPNNLCASAIHRRV